MGLHLSNSPCGPPVVRKMTEVIFPKEWWKMPKEEYNLARIELKFLLKTRDIDAGVMEVKIF